MTSTATPNANGPTTTPGLFSITGSPGVIVLSKALPAGTVVKHPDITQLGDYSPDWNVNSMTAWGGTVTLQN